MEILHLLSSKEDKYSILGDCKNVMMSTKCDVHPRMFRSCFNMDLENVSDFEAYGCRNSVMLFAKAANSSRLSAWSLHLVSDTNQRDPTCRGKIVNSHWIEKNVIRQWKRGCDRRNSKDCQMCPAASRLISTRPCWLIDTWRLCLTKGAVNAP